MRRNNLMLCKHLDEFTGICCNYKSKYVADVCPYHITVNNELRFDYEAPTADCFKEETK